MHIYPLIIILSDQILVAYWLMGKGLLADGEEEKALNNIINADYNTRLTKEVALELVGLFCGFLPEEVMPGRGSTELYYSSTVT